MSQLAQRTVTAAEASQRLDAYCASCGLFGSRAAAAKAIENGEVQVNGQTVAKKHLVQAGDLVCALQAEAPEVLPAAAEPIPLDVRFEDEHLLVISKQAMLVCHPCDDYRSGTLVNALLHHCGPEHLCNLKGEDDRQGIVHRLDRDTTGLMMAAKTDEAGQALMEAIQVKAVDRRYLALVHGILPHDTGMIDAPIARSATDRTRMAVRDVPSARDSLTTFKVLERFEAAPKDNGYTLVECKLFTGRTHQIRVHMTYAGHPLVGDPLYRAHAPKHSCSDLGLNRQFLHSYRLGFVHPVTGEQLEFADNLPTDLSYALDDLEGRSMGKTKYGENVANMLAFAPYPSVESWVYEEAR